MVSGSATVVLSSEQLSTAVDDEEVILDTEAGIYYGLNPVGAHVWELINDPVTVNEVVAAVSEQYDISREQCEADVRAFLADLHDAGLIAVHEDTPPDAVSGPDARPSPEGEGRRSGDGRTED